MMNNDPNRKDQMHPQDLRNLIVFGIVSVTLWFLYEVFILQPQTEAMKKAEVAREKILEQNPQALENAVLLSYDEAVSQVQRVSFMNEEVRGSISLRGGLIDDLSLKNYYKTLEKQDNVQLLMPPQTKGARYMDYGWVSKDSGLVLPSASTQWQVKGNDILQPGMPVTLVWENGRGVRFEREITLDEQYLFTITQRVYNQSDRDITLNPYALLSQKNIPDDYRSMWIAHEGPMGFVGGELHQMDYAAMIATPNAAYEANNGWIGVSDKYWLTALLPDQTKLTKYRFKFTPDLREEKKGLYQTDVTGSAVTVTQGGVASETYHFYAGAKKVLTLEAYQKKLGVQNFDLAVDFGWFWFFTYPFFLALHYIGLAVGNMGVAIIILTAILRTAVFPLTNTSYRSFAKMKVVAPQVAEIRKKYVDDKEKLQSEMVELYQREGVNPMSGCLPILVQIPIFFAFYKILFSTIEIRHAPFFGWIKDLSAPDPTSVFNLFGLIDWTPPSFLMIGAWSCVMLVVMLVQKQLNPPPTDKIQRDMMRIFPFFITFIMASFASGLVIYWTFSALFSVLQQMIIMRSLGVPIYIFNKEHFKEEAKQKEEARKKASEEKVDELDISSDAEPVEDKVISPPKPKKKKKKK